MIVSMRALRSLCFLLLLPLIASCSPVGGQMDAAPAPENTVTAAFALGCYWCGEAAFEGKTGIVDVTAGYMTTGADSREAVRVRFDPATTSYEELLDIFWPNVDPFDDEGQFCDRGGEYRSAIFVYDETQESEAKRSKESVRETLGKDVVTPILPTGEFRAVRESEQDFAKKNPVRYRTYRLNCGRDARLHQVWGGRAGAHD